MILYQIICDSKKGETYENLYPFSIYCYRESEILDFIQKAEYFLQEPFIYNNVCLYKIDYNKNQLIKLKDVSELLNLIK